MKDTLDFTAPCSIREVAEMFGLTHRALRFYEAEGLLSPQRQGTSRLYHAEDIERVRLILIYKKAGVPLDDVRARLKIDPTRAHLDPEQRADLMRATRDEITRLQDQLLQLHRMTTIRRAEVPA